MLNTDDMAARMIELGSAQGAIALAVAAMRDVEYARKRADRYMYLAVAIVVVVVCTAVWVVLSRTPPHCVISA